MAGLPISGSDPPPSTATSNSIASEAEPDGFSAFHGTEVAELAARLSASTGASLSPELSNDLALEIVLHQIVEQACLATGATGAAIVLARDGELVCRASSGPSAPDLGARLDPNAGLSGECLRTCQLQRSADAQNDLRADAEASRLLGIRSVLICPLLEGDTILGVFELFSSRAGAFGERDERTLEVLVDRVLRNLRRASEPPPTVDEASPEPLSSHVLFDGVVENQPSHRGLDIATWAMALAILACAAILGLRLYRGIAPRSAARIHPVADSAIADSTVRNPATKPIAVPSPISPIGTKPMPKSPSTGVAAGLEAEGDLRIYENGKEVFRLPPAAYAGVPDSGQPERVVQITPDAAESALLHRVDPDYPEKARLARIQGPVVLETRIGANGAVRDVRVVSGEPVLADAAVSAVKQWTFRTSQIKGMPTEMQTTITLNFRLPQ